MFRAIIFVTVEDLSVITRMNCCKKCFGKIYYIVIFHIFYFDTHSKLRNNLIELCCYQCEIL